MITRRISSIVFLSMFFISCAYFNGGKKPEVSLVDLQVEGITLFETSAKLLVRITNPNEDPMDIDGAVHEVYINGTYLGRGVSDQSLYIPRLGSSTQEVQVRLNNLSMIGKIQSLLNSSRFDYSIESAFYVKGPLGRWKVTTKESGDFQRRDT